MSGGQDPGTWDYELSEDAESSEAAEETGVTNQEVNMATVQTSIETLVDQAIDELPRREARRARRIMRWANDETKQEIYDDLLMSMSYDAGFSGLHPEVAEGFANDSIGPTTRVSIDPENLRKWIDLILEYLPRILKLFL